MAILATEKWFLPAENSNSEAPNRLKNELHLGNNSSVAGKLIKILKLGGIFTFFNPGLYLQRGVRHSGNYLNIIRLN